jgi:hypothetical protein
MKPHRNSHCRPARPCSKVNLIGYRKDRRPHSTANVVYPILGKWSHGRMVIWSDGRMAFHETMRPLTIPPSAIGHSAITDALACPPPPPPQ